MTEPEPVSDTDDVRVTEIGSPELVDAAEHPWALTLGLLGLMAVILVGVIGLGGLVTVDEQSAEVAQVVVPRLNGRALVEAQEQLETLGLLVDVRYEPNEQAPVDVVVEQEPIAGSRLDVGRQVIVTVSDGPAGVRVPDLADLSAPEAQRLLSALGLPSEIAEVHDEKVPQNVIVGSSPAKGSRLLPGDLVKVLVSVGPEPRTVPQLVGIESVKALASLALAELTVASVTTKVDASAVPGSVLSTSPAGGEKVPRGQPVEIVVAAAPASVLLPDLVGLTRANAQLAGSDAGLEVVIRNETLPEGDIRGGRVIRQEPIANSPVPEDATITVVVGVVPPPTTVPPTTPSTVPGGSTTTTTAPGTRPGG